MILNDTLEMSRDHLVFESVSKNRNSESFIDHDSYPISSKGFLPAVVDIMII